MSLETLLALSHDLGREDRGLAMLGEGNTSARQADGTFLVKASGSNLASLAPAGSPPAARLNCSRCWIARP